MSDPLQRDLLHASNSAPPEPPMAVPGIASFLAVGAGEDMLLTPKMWRALGRSCGFADAVLAPGGRGRGGPRFGGHTL